MQVHGIGLEIMTLRRGTYGQEYTIAEVVVAIKRCKLVRGEVENQIISAELIMNAEAGLLNSEMAEELFRQMRTALDWKFGL